MNAPPSPFERIAQSDVAFLGTDPVPAKAYYDPEWYARERRAIFLRSWIVIGHICELPDPGSFIKRELEFANASLLIVRGKDGVIRAFHNVCTHRGTQLVAEAEGKPLGQHDTAERNLMKLCLSLAHVAQAVEMQGDDEDKHTPSRNAMRFTRSVADQESA